MGNQIQINALIRSDLDTGGVIKKVQSIQQLLGKVKLSPELQKQFNGLFTDLNSNVNKINDQFSKGFETKGAVKNLDSLLTETQTIAKKIAGTFQETMKSDGLDLNLPADQEKQLQQLKKNIEEITTKLNQVKPTNLQQVLTQLEKQPKGKSGQNIANQIQDLIGNGNLKEAAQLLEEVVKKREELSQGATKGAASTATYKADTEALKAMSETVTEAWNNTERLGEELRDLNNDMVDRTTKSMDDFKTEVKDAEVGIEDMNDGLKQTKTDMHNAAQGAQQMNSEMDEIKSRIQYFFSLANAVQLVRQALRQTFEAAKELDAAMTETAVVTDFSVGDMWDMLPKYTKTAQDLGATTQGVYETLTLFYQQGLDTNEAMSLGTEALKMARIAGMDYEEATSKMTAALRGFNMELNEISAQRVNDVYSELAAITAADTDQIATAMTKTASIANSANMEFETTAAFLSQIIETTQESAETAGTAMKTVIARFTELKKDPSLIGEVDGEMIDANKIETALNSIGVALRDQLTGQFRDLDDVFLDIAQKWEGLDTNTQRYIATIAAGSRQQSRFIAMMSDYERTIELVTAANDSAGSSQEQFDKTLESMEAKLNQLKNTWQEFTLGLMDQGILKGAIEALNGLLAAVNKMTDLPGVLGSVSKAFLSFFILFTGKKLFNVASAVVFSAKGSFETGGQVAAISWRKGFSAEFGKTGNFLKKIFAKTVVPAPAMDPAAIDGFKTSIASLDDEFESFEPRIASMKAAERDYTSLISGQNKVTEKKNELLALEASYTKASAFQQAGFNAAVANGATVQQAGILLTKESTEEDFKHIAAQILGKEATEEETETLAKKIMAQQIENGATQLSLLTKAKYIALLLFGNKETKKNIILKLKEAGSTWAAKVAQDGFNSSLMACPVGWIALAVVGLVAAITALILVLKHFSMEEQMNRAAESAQNSVEAVEKAREAFEDLNETIQNVDDAADKIDTLTKGTTEFKTAVDEANLAMMELINQFPELREEGMTFYDKNGVRRLTEEGRATLTKNSYQQLKNAQSINTVGQMYLNEVQKKAAGEDLEDSINEELGKTNAKGVAAGVAAWLGSVATYGGVGAGVGAGFGASAGAGVGGIAGAIGGAAVSFGALLGVGAAGGAAAGAAGGAAAGAASGAVIGGIIGAIAGIPAAIEAEQKASSDYYQDKIIEALETRGAEGDPLAIAKLFDEAKTSSGEWSAEFTKFAEETGLTAEELYQLRDSVVKYGERIDAENQQNISIAKEHLIEVATDEMKESLSFDKVTDIYAKANREDAIVTEDEIKEEENTVDSKKEKKQLATDLKLDVNLEGLSEEAMAKRLYSAVTGIPESDITLSKDDIEVELAKLKIANKRDFGAEGMAAFYNNLEKASEEARTEIETILSGDLDFTAEQLDNLFQADGTINQAVLDQMKQAYEDTYGDIEAHKINIQRQEDIAKAEGASDAASSALSELAENGVIEDSTALLATLGQIEGLYNNLGTAAQEWHIISSQGILAQMDYLADLQAQQYAQKKKNINDAKAERQALLQEQQNLYAALDSDPLKLGQKNEIKDRLEEIKKVLSATDWVIDIKVTDNFDQIETQVDNLISSFKSIVDATGDLEEGFKLSADKADSLSQAFPGILENATIAYDGTITLNEEVRKAILETAETEIRANAETQKAIVKQEIAKLEGFIDRKELELSVVKSVLEQENQATAGALLADLANEGEFTQEMAQYESDRVKTHENALGVQGDNFFEEKEYELSLQDKAGIDMAAAYSADIKANAEAAEIKTGDQAGFFSRLGEAIQKFLNGDWSGAWSALTGKTASGGTVYYNPAGGTFSDDDMKDRFGSDFQIVKDADGNLDSVKTLTNYFNQEYGALELARTQLKLQKDNIAEIDAYAKSAIYQLQNPGKDGSGKNDKEKWEYKRDYDENIKAQLKGKENERSTLEAELEGLIEDENATIEDIIAKKTEIAAVAEEQLNLLKSQLELDLQEVDKLKNQHTEWSDLYSIDENGVITWDEDKINAMNFTDDQGEEFDEWSENLTTAVENSAATALDIVNMSNEINSFLAPIINEFDEIYNNEKKIETLQQKRLKLEHEFEKLVSSQVVSLSQLVDNLLGQSATLEEEKSILQDNLNIATSNLLSKINSDDKFSKYYSYNASTNQLTIDTKTLDKLAEAGQDEAYEEVKEFLEGLEKTVDSIDEYTSDIYDIESKQLEIQQKGKDSYSDLENTIYEGIITYMENQLSDLEDLYGSIDDSNSRIIDAINESLSLQRQQRSNEKTEEELGDLRNRIAYLSMDTTGRNQGEILNLQRQLEEKEQDYTDTLIDQKISELQKQNDIAAEQREYQISLLNEQHKQAMENGTYLAAAETALQTILDDGGSLDTITLSSLGEAVNIALGGSKDKGALSGLTNDTSSILTGLEEFWPKDKTLYEILHDGDDRMPTQSEYEEENNGYLKQLAYISAGINEARENLTWRDGIEAILHLFNEQQLDPYTVAIYDLNNNGEIDEEDIQLIEDAWLKGADPSKYRAFATGGLADYTGPAWLDGTKSRPELVLNQTDTQNFLALKDILSSFLSNNNSTQNSAEKGGDNYYEIHLQVEKITSDYDVEQLANKVKSIIAEDANSRGVNSIYRRR